MLFLGPRLSAFLIILMLEAQHICVSVGISLLRYSTENILTMAMLKNVASIAVSTLCVTYRASLKKG